MTDSQRASVESTTAPDREPQEETTSASTDREVSPPEEGEMPDDAPPLPDEAPPLSDEPLPDGAPPLPDEPLPVAVAAEEDDGWAAQLDVATGCWFFTNRFTGVSQWENPRIPSAAAPAVAPGTEAPSRAPGTSEAVVPPPSPPREPYLGYNPKIHGDFDPNADYAKYHRAQQEQGQIAQEAGAGDAANPTTEFGQAATFNRFTGAFQGGDKNSEHHNDENKSRRQMHAFFDVDRAANTHDGRSLKAERANQRLSKKQVKAFNEQRRAKKEQKRRDFLMS